MSMRLEIVSAGPSISIQDGGRPGFGRYGLSRGGAMDSYAMAEGAVLLDNKSTDSAIEMAGFGGRFRAVDGPLQIALTGAEMHASIEGTAVPWRCNMLLTPGQTLEIGSVREKTGTYGYLHVAGGFSLPAEIGSMGTHLRAGVGGIDGKPLQSATLLETGASKQPDFHPQKLPQPQHLDRAEIRIVWGAQSARFSAETRERMLQETFSISHRRDRMAMRLAPMDNDAPFEALLSGLSDPVQDGEIQMTGDGVPAIVAREHQPTGGYPRIASVIAADLSAAAQLQTGAPFHFVLVDYEAAEQALQQWRNGIEQLGSLLQPVIRSPDDITNLLDYNLIGGVVSAAEDTIN